MKVAPEWVAEMITGEGLKLEVPGTAIFEGEELPITLRPVGKSTLAEPKKSYELDLRGGRFEGMREIRLAATTADPSMLRTPLSLEVFRAAGLPTPIWEFIALYLNGAFLGLYLHIEKVDQDFLARRGIPISRLYEAEDGADFEDDMPTRLDSAFSVKPGPPNLEKMLALGRVFTLANDVEFQRQAFNFLDRGSVIRYLAACQLTNHFDGFNKNLFYADRIDTGRMDIVPWDFDNDWRFDLSPERDSMHRNRLWARLYGTPEVKRDVDSLVSSLANQTVPLRLLFEKEAEWKERIRSAWDSDPFLVRAGRTLDEATRELHRAIEQRYSQVRKAKGSGAEESLEIILQRPDGS